MNNKKAIIPIEITTCWLCPHLYIYRCAILKKSVKEAVKDDTIDSECPHLTFKNNR